MIVATLLVLLAVQTPGPIDQTIPTSAECTAAAIRPLVHPTGTTQEWPDAELPEHLRESLGVLILDQGAYQDGYSFWLVLDEPEKLGYVARRGGYAGEQKVYGPLPLSSCPAAR